MSRPMTHAKYGPSSLVHMRACPQWENNGETSPAAERGTRIHADLEHFIATNGTGSETLVTCEDEDKEAVAFGVYVLTDPFVLGRGWKFQAEVLSTGMGVPDTWGTCDVVGKNPATGDVLVLDWKTGETEHHVYSDIQMYSHVLAFGATHVAIVELDLRRVDMMTVDVHYLRRAHREVMEAIFPSFHEPRLCNSCRYCAKRAVCPAVLGESLPVVSAPLPVEKKLIERLPAPQLAELLDKYSEPAKRVDEWIGAAKHQATKILLAGGAVGDWRLKKIAGNLKWADHWAEGNPSLQVPCSPYEAIKRICATGLEPDEAENLVKEHCTRAADKISLVKG